jgi:hypothetical protein
MELSDEKHKELNDFLLDDELRRVQLEHCLGIPLKRFPLQPLSKEKIIRF